MAERKSGEWTPEQLGMASLNMKTSSATYTSPLLDVRDYTRFQAHLSTNNTGGGAAGAASMQVLMYAADGTTLLQTINLFTALATTADSEVSVIFGAGCDGVLTGGGTIGTNINALRVLSKIKLRVTVATASDATTCVSSLRFEAQY